MGLFCTIMLPVTNYRFRKSMGWALNRAIAPETPLGKASVFGIVVWAACIISSPGNEWRGYTLQPKDRKLPFAEYFKPINYMRSTGVGATIMGIALMVGMLVTPYAEMLFAYLKEHMMVGLGALVAIALVFRALTK